MTAAIARAKKSRADNLLGQFENAVVHPLAGRASRWGGELVSIAATARKLLALMKEAHAELDRELFDAFDVRAPKRTCSWCDGPMPEGRRTHATTCGKACRQAKSRGGTSRRRRRLMPWGKSARPLQRATLATPAGDELVPDVGATDAGKRRGRSLEADDWRSSKHRAEREQLSIVAPPIEHVRHHFYGLDRKIGDETPLPAICGEFAEYGSALLDGITCGECRRIFLADAERYRCHGDPAFDRGAGQRPAIAERITVATPQVAWAWPADRSPPSSEPASTHQSEPSSSSPKPSTPHPPKQTQPRKQHHA